MSEGLLQGKNFHELKLEVRRGRKERDKRNLSRRSFSIHEPSGYELGMLLSRLLDLNNERGQNLSLYLWSPYSVLVSNDSETIWIDHGGRWGRSRQWTPLVRFLLAPLEIPKLANAQPSNFGPLPYFKKCKNKRMIPKESSFVRLFGT